MIGRDHPLYNAFAKLRRGGEHINSLRALIGNTFGTIPIGYRRDLDSGEDVLYLDLDPESFLNDLVQVGLIVGDIVHNLRASLDYLVFGLAVLNTGDNVEKPDIIQFPLTDTEEGWNGQLYRLGEISDKHREELRRLQPSNPDNVQKVLERDVYFLRELREFSNIDKHRHLIEMEIRPAGILPYPTYIDTFQFLVESGVLHNEYSQEVIRIDTRHFNTEIFRIMVQDVFPERDVNMITATQAIIRYPYPFELIHMLDFIRMEVNEILVDFLRDVS